ERAEAARPKPPIQQMRERARAATVEPILNPSARDVRFHFDNVSTKAVLTAIAGATGINVMYDRDFVDRPVTVDLPGVSVEEALNYVLNQNQYTYKVINDRTILVFQDTVPKHLQYDDQVIKTIYLSNSDVTEVAQILSQVMRVQNLAIQPAI